MKHDELDKQIMNLLLENSRLSYRQIAKKLKVSAATIMNRTKLLEKGGIIKNYTISIDYEKVGFDIEAIIEMRISKGKLIEVENKITKKPNKQEFSVVVKVSAIGIGLIGLIGFIVYIGWELLK